jgi:4-diphosphocytidyl-2-C-methyl-D-erythritol kinase
VASSDAAATWHRLLAPAKVNLGLRVVGRRDDGYHRLESLFVPLDLVDDVALRRREATGIGLRLDPSVPGIPSDERNLAFRAAAALLEAAGAEGGVEIRLHKRIPSPAGLGGGSSDAGAVLRGLAQLLGAPPAREDLVALALSLGADVPWFLDPRPALVTGIGEEVAPLGGIPSLSLVLAHPGVPLATPEVYRAYDADPAPSTSLTRPGAGSSLPRLLALRGEGASLVSGLFEADDGDVGGGLDPDGWRDLLWNDLEPPAARLCPGVAALREEFEATEALAVGMSGSGPTMYGIFPDAGKAQEGARKLAGKSVRTWVVESVASPGERHEPASPTGA